MVEGCGCRTCQQEREILRGLRQQKPFRRLVKPPVLGAPYGKGIGGAPTRPSTMPRDAAERKRRPVVSGVLDYFPDAILAIAELSMRGNEQHNPGKPLHWDRSKSGDEADTCVRHLMERGSFDTDGVRHSAKAAWRALALLQKEIEAGVSEMKMQGMTVKVDPGCPPDTVFVFQPYGAKGVGAVQIEREGIDGPIFRVVGKKGEVLGWISPDGELE